MTSKFFLVAGFILLNTVSAFSLELKDCESSLYKPTTKNTVVAIDLEDNVPLKKGFVVINEVFFEMDATDASCLKLDILQNGVVTCIDTDNKKTVVGKVNKVLSREDSLDFYTVDWISKVHIKSFIRKNMCMYAIAL